MIGLGLGMCNWALLVAQMVKNLPAMWETWVRSLGQEDSLAKGMTSHSSILAWRMTAHPSILPGESRGQGRLVGYSP